MKRQRQTTRWHGLLARFRGFPRADGAARREYTQDLVACGARGGRVTIRAGALRRLRQHDEQRRLAEREPLGLLAEPCQRRRAHALDIAAIRREREIKREDLALAQPRLELHGARDLDQLGAETARSRLEQARGLHRQGRAAGDDLAAGHRLRNRAQQGERIDAGMKFEPLIFIGLQQREVARIDVCRRRCQPPFAVRRRERAQQPLVLVDDQGRDLACPREIRREQAIGDDGGCDKSESDERGA